MCAYKLCRVEFKYWGMQNKIERFIHESGNSKTNTFLFDFSNHNNQILSNSITQDNAKSTSTGLGLAR
mgnify:CR=1 FL=1